MSENFRRQRRFGRDNEASTGLAELAAAYAANNDQQVRTLLEALSTSKMVVDIHAPLQDGSTLLHTLIVTAAKRTSVKSTVNDASRGRHQLESILQALVHLGVNVNAQNSCGNDDTALHAAARAGNKYLYALLVQYGANVHKPNRRGVTPAEIGSSQWNFNWESPLHPSMIARAQSATEENGEKVVAVNATSKMSDRQRPVSASRSATTTSVVQCNHCTSATQVADDAKAQAKELQERNSTLWNRIAELQGVVDALVLLSSHQQQQPQQKEDPKKPPIKASPLRVKEEYEDQCPKPGAAFIDTTTQMLKHQADSKRLSERGGQVQVPWEQEKRSLLRERDEYKEDAEFAQSLAVAVEQERDEALASLKETKEKLAELSAARAVENVGNPSDPGILPPPMSAVHDVVGGAEDLGTPTSTLNNSSF